MTVTRVRGNITFGSKRFEEQRAERKRNGPGTLIRNRDYTNRAGGGERRETGRIREVDFPAGNRVEHFDPEGNEKPQRGVEIRGEAGIAGQDSGNGIAVLISPEPGLTGESEGIVTPSLPANIRFALIVGPDSDRVAGAVHVRDHLGQSRSQLPGCRKR